MKKDQTESKNSTYKMIFVGTALTGVVTVLILGAAIALGLYLDDIFNSAKHIFTVILVIISIPLTIVGLLWSARFTTQRYGVQKQENTDKVIKQEDA